MRAMLSPGFRVEPPRASRRVEGVATDVAAFVGVAQRGTLNAPARIDGWPGFVAAYGGFAPNALLAYAVRAFFEAGGRACYVVRVAAPERVALAPAPRLTDRDVSALDDATGFCVGALASLSQSAQSLTAGPQPADGRSSVVGDARGFHPGALTLLTQAGAPAAWRRVAAQDKTNATLRWDEPLPAAFDLDQPIAAAAEARDERLVVAVNGDALTWDAPLDDRFDPGLPLRVAAGAAAATLRVRDETGAPALEFAASSPGRWGNGVELRLSRRRAETIATRGRDAPAPAGVLALTRIGGLARGALVEIEQAGAPTARREIAAVDAAAGQVALDLPPPAGFDLFADAAGVNPISVTRLAFTLSVWRDGRLEETHEGLNPPPPDAPDSAPVNAASRLLRIRRIGPACWPDPDAPPFLRGLARLEGGRDGIAMLRPEDILGSASAPAQGLATLETLEEPALLAIPDLMIEPVPFRRAKARAPEPADPCALCPPAGEPPRPVAPAAVEAAPRFTPDEVSAMQQTMARHCEANGERIAILDVPRDPRAADPHAPEAALAWRQPWDSSYAAAYYPFVLVDDPVGADLRAIPPSGHACGIISAQEAARGPQAAPANVALRWAAALGRTVDADTQDLLHPAGLNCLRAFGGRGFRLYGARTLSRAADWRHLSVRRMAIRLRRALRRALAWVPFEPNDARTRACALAVAQGFLDQEWRAGRLAGSVAAEAYRLAAPVGSEAIDNGGFVLEIGFAPVIPAEFVLLRLARAEDRLEIADFDPTGEAAP